MNRHNFPENGRICSQVQEKMRKKFCICLHNSPNLSVNSGFREAGIEVWISGSKGGEETGGTPMPTGTVCLLPTGLRGQGYCQGIQHPAGWM